MRKVRKCLHILVALAAMGCMACEDDNDAGNGSTSTETGADSSVQQAVNQNVKYSYATYDKYYLYTVSVNSTLQSVYPGKQISYGVEYGYGAYDLCKTNSSSSSTFVVAYCNGGGSENTADFTYHGMKIWGYSYYTFNSIPSLQNLINAGVSLDNMADISMGLRFYYALQDKLDNGQTLTSSEQSMYNDAKKLITSGGMSTVKSKLSVRVFVMVDGQKYIVGSFGNGVVQPSGGNTGGGNTGGGNTGGGNTGGGTTTYEKPEIGYYDCTVRTTSITIKYRIYNQDEAKVTSAKVYYGTSSPTKSVTATVSGSMITANVSGLKKNTSYYFKCTATGKGGSATSETTHLITAS